MEDSRSSPSEPPHPFRLKRAESFPARRMPAPPLLLFVMTVAAFSPVLGHHFIESWDDRTAILANPDYNPPHWRNLIHYWTRPPAKGLFYVPVTYTLWGAAAFVARHSAPPGVPFDPRFFYAINLVAHAGSAAMAFLILRELVRPVWAAWAGAAFFALHPIQVEAVANAWGMYTPLSAAFAFFAMWQYLRWSDRTHGDDPRERAAAWRNYAAACAGFALALLTKPTVAAVPLMLGAIELGLRGRKWRAVVWALGPWLAAAAAVAWFNQRIPATGRVYVPDIWLRPMVPLDAITFYLAKILVPLNLCMDYGRTPWSVAGKPAVHLTCVVGVALIVFAWRVRRRWPYAATAFAVFVAALIPVSGIVPFTFQYYSTVADRYAYLAMLGPALGVAALCARFRGRAAAFFASFGLLVLGSLSVVQLRYWVDDWRMAAHTLAANPRSVAAIGTFKYLFIDAHRDQPPGAASVADRCTLSRPALIETGDRLDGYGSYDLAAECYRRAIPLGPPDAQIYGRLGAALAHDDGSRAAAEQACRDALRIDPNDATARRTLEELARDAH